MRREGTGPAILVALLLACIVLYGVSLRLRDPLSTDAIAAEDPYTHIVFTKEWIDQGYFADSFHLGTEMYPPGMHAFMAAFVPTAGVALYDFARIAPAIFGALAILGMYVVGARLGGETAGLGAALLTAIIPEHAFRTELLFPTALDLALLPLWLVAFHAILEGHRVGGAALFLGAGVPLAVMHPWTVPLFAVPLAIYAALRVLREEEEARLAVRKLALPIAILLPLIAFAMAFRWEESDTGFSDFMAKIAPLAPLAAAELPRPLLFALLLAILAPLAALGVGSVAALCAARPPRAVRVGIAVATGAALLALVPFLARDLPLDVDYRVMLGVLAGSLALVGFALAFLRPTALGDMGLAIAVVFFPLTALDIFGGPYWPQRTVAYLTIGVALLGASVAAHAHELPVRLAKGRSASVAPVALVVVMLLLAGGAAATSRPLYTWYRLYNEDQFHGFEEVGARLEADPGSRVFIHTWQPALLVKTFADPDHVWYSPNFFLDPAKRADLIPKVHGTAYVLVDKYTERAETKGKADLDFLDDGSRYQLVHASLDGGLRLYKVST